MVDRARCGTGPNLLAFGNLEIDMTPEQIEQMKAALANASKKPWSAFTDDSRDTLHTNIVG